MRTYQRIVISAHGGPEVLKLVEAPLPQPRHGEVRVRVLAAGVGYSDVMAQHGGYPLAPRPPFTPGYDLAGVVDAIGPGVSDLEVGQPVAALSPRFGGYAQYALLPAGLVVPHAPELDAAEVVCLVLNYLTAHGLLHRKARVTAGETVLVHAAAGGVGTALLQLGALAGLTMYGTVSRRKQRLVEDLGGIAIDYRSVDFVRAIRAAVPRGVDAAFDAIGGEHLRRSYRAVRRGGRVVSYGFAGEHFGGLLPMVGGVLQLGLLNLLPDGRCVRLCATPGEAKRDPGWYRETLASLLDLLRQRRLRPIVGARLPLREAARAHELLAGGSVSGKIVLLPWD